MLPFIKLPSLAALAAGAASCAAGTVLLAAVVTYNAGAVHVSVLQKTPGGSHIRLFVPAVLVPVAMDFVPARKLHLKDKRRWLPLAKVASLELEKCPDATLVEVIDPKEHVHIRKQGDSIVIDVDDPNETVHVSFPVRTLRSVVEKFEASEPPA
jgi:hypothetical protein